MKMKKIKYKIDQRDGPPKEVEGYAVASSLPLRYCVRKQYRKAWRGDHFDSGLSLSAWGRTRAICIARTEELIKQSMENGLYYQRMKELGIEA